MLPIHRFCKNINKTKIWGWKSRKDTMFHIKNKEKDEINYFKDKKTFLLCREFISNLYNDYRDNNDLQSKNYINPVLGNALDELRSERLEQLSKNIKPPIKPDKFVSNEKENIKINKIFITDTYYEQTFNYCNSKYFKKYTFDDMTKLFISGLTGPENKDLWDFSGEHHCVELLYDYTIGDARTLSIVLLSNYNIENDKTWQIKNINYIIE